MTYLWIEPNHDAVSAVRILFEEYAEELGRDLCFQGFPEELESLPGRYTAPTGALLYAIESGHSAACGAIRQFEPRIAEIKRMYVRPEHRGLGIGREVLRLLIEKTSELGYRKARLDTLASLKPAIALYKSFGFTEIPAYYENPIEDVVYMELELPRPD